MKISELALAAAADDAQVLPIVDGAVTKKITVGTLKDYMGSVPTAWRYAGTWNATTNTPALVSSVGVAGYAYYVATAGTTTLNGLAVWAVGDWLLFDGTVWRRVNGAALAAATLATLTDVLVTSLVDGDMLVYDSTTSKWNNVKQVTPDISAAGTVQADATAISARVNVVRTVTSGAGVRLVYDGTPKRVINRGANELKVWPQTSGDFESQGANLHAVIPVGGTTDFIPDTSTTWVTTP